MAVKPFKLHEGFEILPQAVKDEPIIGFCCVVMTPEGKMGIISPHSEAGFSETFLNDIFGNLMSNSTNVKTYVPPDRKH